MEAEEEAGFVGEADFGSAGRGLEDQLAAGDRDDSAGQDLTALETFGVAEGAEAAGAEDEAFVRVGRLVDIDLQPTGDDVFGDDDLFGRWLAGDDVGADEPTADAGRGERCRA